MLTKWDGQESTPAGNGIHHWKVLLFADVRNMEGAMLAHPAIQWPTAFGVDASNGYWAKMGPRNHHVAIAQSQHHIINSTNPSGALDNGIEDRLHVRGRAADNAEHLGSRCLMLQCFAEL